MKTHLTFLITFLSIIISCTDPQTAPVNTEPQVFYTNTVYLTNIQTNWMASNFVVVTNTIYKTNFQTNLLILTNIKTNYLTNTVVSNWPLLRLDASLIQNRLKICAGRLISNTVYDYAEFYSLAYEDGLQNTYCSAYSQLPPGSNYSFFFKIWLNESNDYTPWYAVNAGQLYSFVTNKKYTLMVDDSLLTNVSAQLFVEF